MSETTVTETTVIETSVSGASRGAGTPLDDDRTALPAAALPPAPRSGVRTTTPGALWRQLRVPAAIATVVLFTALGLAFSHQQVTAGSLDPSSVTPAGSRALAQLVQDRGVRVRRATSLPATPTGTVFIPFAGELTADQLRPFLAPGPGAHVVMVAPGGTTQALGVELRELDAGAGVRQPGCALAGAQTAGAADVGDHVYEVAATDATIDTCYAAGGRPSLVRITRGNADVTVLGSSVAFTNDRLDDEGNAALALALLDRGAPVTWVMRTPAGSATGDDARPLGDLLPDGVRLAALQLLIAVVVAALWRGRRLGPVVTERLPVIVRASEAAEGRGRLYAAANARGRAAGNLRAGARNRLRTLLSLPADASAEVLVDAVAARTGRPAGDVGTLLYGPDPADDTAMVRLAADLDSLNRQVRRS